VVDQEAGHVVVPVARGVGGQRVTGDADDVAVHEVRVGRDDVVELRVGRTRHQHARGPATLTLVGEEFLERAGGDEQMRERPDRLLVGRRTLGAEQIPEECHPPQNIPAESGRFNPGTSPIGHAEPPVGPSLAPQAGARAGRRRSIVLCRSSALPRVASGAQ
jgi:hypothetical protein